MRIIFSSLAIFIGLSAVSQNKFSVEGTLSNISKVSKVFLYYSGSGGRMTDSSVVTDGKYQFNGNIDEPAMARLLIRYIESDTARVRQAINMKRDMVGVFLEPGTIRVSSVDSFSNVEVSGSASHQEYELLKLKLKDVEARQEALSKEYSALYQKKDEEGMKKMEAAFDTLSLETKSIHKAWFQSNPGSPIALYVLQQCAGWDINAEEIAPLFAQLPERLKSMPSGKDLLQKIEIAQKTVVGQQAMDFTQNDTLGNPVTLSSFRGKYVLIDFWASWCGPCRAENPNLVKAYQQFKDKGFHIIGVSLDQANAKEKWLKAIHDDKLSWTQVSDLQYWKNAVAVQYGIQAIPQNFLLDPAGKIIAKNMRGEELAAKLEALLNKP